MTATADVILLNGLRYHAIHDQPLSGRHISAMAHAVLQKCASGATGKQTSATPL